MVSTTSRSPARVALVCPFCHSSLFQQGEVLRCDGCGRNYGRSCGIADLRLSYSGSYVSRGSDAEIARALHAAAGGGLDLAGLLREHWRLTGAPEDLATRFVSGDLAARAKSEDVAAILAVQAGDVLVPGARVLEVGCGTAALAAALARRGADVVATDIGLRWLVLAAERFRDEGVSGASLVCCSAESAPFADGSFDLVVASDVIEHVNNIDAFVAGCARLLRPGGLLFLATPNRYSLGLEPHVRLPALGYLPRSLAVRAARTMRDADYSHVRLLSARGLRELLDRHRLQATIVAPEVSAAALSSYRGLERRLVLAYNSVRTFGPVHAGLLAVGPFFHVFARKRAA